MIIYVNIIMFIFLHIVLVYFSS